MTKDEIVRILAVLAAAYPKEQLSQPTIELYRQMLGDLPYDAVEAAALDHIATSKWFPKISEIREAAMDLAQTLPPTPDEALAVAKYHALQPPAKRKSLENIVIAHAWSLAGGSKYGISNDYRASEICTSFLRLYKRLLAQERRREWGRAGLNPSHLIGE